MPSVEGGEGMTHEFVPLYQTVLWLVAIIVVGFVIRTDLHRLWDAIVTRIERGGSLKVGPVEFGELREEVAAVRQHVTRLESAVAELFLATMSDAMFGNLKKLASGRFGAYRMGGALQRELYHLRDIGYIEVESVRSIPPEGTDLSAYVSITEPGRNFVRLREGITVQQNSLQA
jgi:hypothetical protein